MIDLVKKPTRSIAAIAREIQDKWPRPNYAAIPYISAMRELHDMNSVYITEDAHGIVLYFLANASTWRGEDAKRIKDELRAMLAAHRTRR